MSRLSAVLGPVLLATMLAGCSVIASKSQVRGNKVDPDVLKELVPGTSTRADVISLIGSPTAKAVFDDNTWYYITETTYPRIGRVLGVEDQEVVVMTFGANGGLRTVRSLDESAGKPVQVVARSTPSPGSEASFMQQLLGNVGKFSATPASNNPGAGAGESGATFGTPSR